MSALIMNGFHDTMTPDCAIKMHELMPNARVKIFKNAAHLPMWEQPEEYSATLLAFLDAHRG
jgi:proline iminopeptidase